VPPIRPGKSLIQATPPELSVSPPFAILHVVQSAFILIVIFLQ